MKKWLLILYLIIAIPLFSIITILNIRLHTPGDDATSASQLYFLKTQLQHNAAVKMQTMFPEGYVFTWALYGLASAQLASRLSKNDAMRQYYLAETLHSLDKLRSDEARAVFTKNLKPAYGAFYSAWLMYLQANYIQAVGTENATQEEIALFETQCAQFTQVLVSSATPFLPSYYQAVWPADTAVGIGALGIRDKLFKPKYHNVIKAWVAESRKRLDPQRQALSHAANYQTGAPLGGVRGSSLALMSRVLFHADESFAREQYEVLRNHFVDFQWGMPGIREYPKGVGGRGDIDSGPIIMSYSGPAIVVGAAAARVHGDESLADVMLSAIEFVGMPVQWGGRFYAGGLLPVGDAFIAWSRSSPLGKKQDWKRIIPWWWTLPSHMVLFLVYIILFIPIIVLVRRKK